MRRFCSILIISTAAGLSSLAANARGDVVFDRNRGAVGVATVGLTFSYSTLDDFGRERLQSGRRDFGSIDVPNSAGVLNLSGNGSFEGVVGVSSHGSATTFRDGVLSASGNGSTSTNSMMLPGDPEVHFNRINRGLTLTMYQLDFAVIGEPEPYSFNTTFSKGATVFVDGGNVASTFGNLEVVLQDDDTNGFIHRLELDREDADSGSLAPMGMLNPGSYRFLVSAQASSSFGENIGTTGVGRRRITTFCFLWATRLRRFSGSPRGAGPFARRRTGIPMQFQTFRAWRSST
jgi:hypothetical protein